MGQKSGQGKVKVICYGKEEIWKSRREAVSYYRQAMAAAEGSECERYTKIYMELREGLPVCRDE